MASHKDSLKGRDTSQVPPLERSAREHHDDPGEGILCVVSKNIIMDVSRSRVFGRSTPKGSNHPVQGIFPLSAVVVLGVAPKRGRWSGLEGKQYKTVPGREHGCYVEGDAPLILEFL